jgi:hypothetical protein
MSFPFVQPYFGLGNSLQTAQASGGGAVGGWVELARTTLGSAGDTISVSSLPDKRYYMVLGDIQPSGNVYTRTWLNADSGSNYATRYSGNGAVDSTITSTNDTVTNKSTDTTPYFTVQYLANLSGQEKLWINHSVEQETAGAGNAPDRMESVNKWANTSNPISTIQQTNEASGDLASGSELVVLGWDTADTHTSNFWEELANVDLTGGANANLSSGTISAKKYLWLQYYVQATSGTPDLRVSFNNDSGSNYARRRSINGGSDGVRTSQTSLDQDGGLVKLFGNAFIINNASNEKLCIFHSVREDSSGSGNAPNRRETVGKWANTSNQITEIDLDVSSSTMTTSSYMRVWGAD